MTLLDPCLSDSELEELHRAFLQRRKDDGCVGLEDMHDILPGTNHLFDSRKLVTSADGTGRLCLLEVIAIAMHLWREYKEVYQTFNILDETGYGSVNRAELREGMAKLSGGKIPSDEYVDTMMKKADVDADGYINMQDLVGMTFPSLVAAEARVNPQKKDKQQVLDEILLARTRILEDYDEFKEHNEYKGLDELKEHEEFRDGDQFGDSELSTFPPTPSSDSSLTEGERTSLQKAFELMDTDSDGFLSCKELRVVLTGVLCDAELSEWMKKADFNGDRLVSCHQFLDAIDSPS
eukprot:GEMP01039009.1.p1 GENE.GEMP01039009.1~~GEMP01039009.1.p1  ORF type:complete len:293 (+),score=61.19 GEMP01039009.1:68-946(+)